MPRVYVRRFDHDEARARHAAGESIRALADEYGVTYVAVYYIVKPDKQAAQSAYARRWRVTPCGDCGGPAQRASYRGDYPRCRACAAKAATTSVRDDTLRCFSCREWKPDDEFPRSAGKRSVGRRCRHTYCRACCTAAKSAYYERKKIPCVACGKPRLPANLGNAGRYADTGLCHTCYVASCRKTAA